MTQEQFIKIIKADLKEEEKSMRHYELLITKLEHESNHPVIKQIANKLRRIMKDELQHSFILEDILDQIK